MDARMAEIDLAALTSPVAEKEPCGPDLDLSGDADYMNFVAKAENLFPSSFFSGPDGRPFDRSTIDFTAELTAMQPLLARTRDVRLLVILAKLSILNRDLAGFEIAVCAIQELLKQRWDEVHPRGDDGVFTARAAALETLDDLPQVIFPLQYTPFVHHPRIGQIGYRNYMIATGEVAAREGEGAHDLTAIENALMEADLPQLIATIGRLEALRTALADIRRACTEQAGFEQAPKLERLPALVDTIRSLLNSFIAKRDPAAGLDTAPSIAGVEPGADTVPTSELRSLADVADALAAIADYFVHKEPSNPALLLVRQAEQLMGKSFFEVMQILVPRHVEEAAIYIGKEQMLQLPIGRLSELVSSCGAPSSVNGDAGAAPSRSFAAATRADAVRLLEQVGAYYRAVEPSSPLPHLTDRARDLAGRDFLSLLKHVLPAFNSDSLGS
jgi:type VI secretion system protein ImpA